MHTPTARCRSLLSRLQELKASQRCRRLTIPSSGRAKGCALVPPLKSNVRRRTPRDGGRGRNAKYEISRARCKGRSGPAHYAALWWRMNLQTARSLRTHLPNRRDSSDGRWYRVFVASQHFTQFSQAGCGPPVPLRWRSAQPRGAREVLLCALVSATAHLRRRAQ